MSCRAFILLALVAATARAVTNPLQFRVIYEWKTIDFAWPSTEAREKALNDSSYIQKNVLISGINYNDSKIFLTVPRMLPGVPVTLATVPAVPSVTAPVLTPFPSWEANALGDCNALQFVQNVEIDRDGVMWVIDNGRTGTMTPQPDTRCPPAVVLIDLKANNAMQRYPLPADVVSYNSSYLNDLVVDSGAGDSDYAYITDNSLNDPGIVVFRRRDGRAWKVRDSQSMTGVDYASNFRINGSSVSFNVNIDGIALGPPAAGGERLVYYSPLASFHLYAVNASALRDEALAARGPDALRPYVRDIGAKHSQTDGMKMDDAGNLYYGLLGNYTIARWNSKTDFPNGQRTVARDPNYIQWVDRFAFDDSGNIYAVVNRLYNFVSRNVSTDEVNYRILKSHTGTGSYVRTAPAPAAPTADTTPAPRSAGAVPRAALVGLALSALTLLAA